MTAFVSKQPEPVSPDRASGESGHDHGEMARSGDHWIASVSFTLEGRAAVGVNVRNNRQPC